MAVARDLKGENFNVGFQPLSAWTMITYSRWLLKRLQQLTPIKTPFNDDGMGVFVEDNALQYPDVRASKMYLRAKDEFEHAMGKLPLGGEMLSLAKRVKKSVKDMVIPGAVWEELGFIGLGPVDGHDIAQLIETFQLAKEAKLPVFIHAITVKGKGSDTEAEVSVEGRIGYHARPNKLNPGVAPKGPKYEDVFGNTLIKLAETDKKILAVTAAMRSGTGLDKFSQVYPERFFDVGIAEQHAVTFAAGLATEGFKPVGDLQHLFAARLRPGFARCLPAKSPGHFCDGPGRYRRRRRQDSPGSVRYFLPALYPNIVLMAPKDENELQTDALHCDTASRAYRAALSAWGQLWCRDGQGI